MIWGSAQKIATGCFSLATKFKSKLFVCAATLCTNSSLVPPASD
nr:hypothetical protein [Mycoplasmopsis bovis]